MKVLMNVILGENVNDVYSNITNFYTAIIPQINSTILLKESKRNLNGGKFKVNSILYDYSHVMEDNTEDNGKEMIFVFVEKI